MTPSPLPSPDRSAVGRAFHRFGRRIVGLIGPDVLAAAAIAGPVPWAVPLALASALLAPMIETGPARLPPALDSQPFGPSRPARRAPGSRRWSPDRVPGRTN